MIKDSNILFKTRQHKIILFIGFIKLFCLLCLPVGIVLFYFLEISIVYKIFFISFLIFGSFYYNYFFWSRSYFMVTNHQISKSIKNGIFSKYEISIYFENIRDIAYSKNNLFHYIFDYGTFFARSSAGAQGDFTINTVPNIEKIYSIINSIHMISSSKRESLKSLDQLSVNPIIEKETEAEVIEKEKNKLLSIQGISEVFLLDNEDKKYLFENEEDRNHGVFEVIRKKLSFCFTHDDTFRDADAPIVLKLGKKVIFPAVSFHEVTRDSTVSASPGIKTHEYLVKKCKKLEKDDATVLVGFDI